VKFSLVQRLGGMSIIIGAILLTLWTICWTFLLPIHERLRDVSLLIVNHNWIWISSISLFGVILMIFGFTAAYARMYHKVGISGFIGFLLVIIAYIFQAAKITWEIFIYPVLAENSSSIFLLRDRVLFVSPLVVLFKWLSLISIFVGVILFCISLIRSKEFPKLSGYLVFCGAILYGIGPMIHIYLAVIGVVILSLGCFFIGYRMLSQRGE
jgi:hypothetical protein